MTPLRVPRLELIENSNNKNDFIIFRYQTHSKKVPTFHKKRNFTSKKRKYKTTYNKLKPTSHYVRALLKSKTKKHKKSKSIFNIF